MSIFSEAITLIRAVEDHLVSEIGSTNPLLSYLKCPIWLSTRLLKPFDYFKRLIWLPTKFLKIGVSEKMKGVFFWVLLMSAFFMLGEWFIGNYGIAKIEAINIVALEAMIVPMFLIIFAMPSMYGDSGVSQYTVKFVVQHLQIRGFASVSDVEILKKSVKPFEDRSRSRVNTLKWLVGLLWASFMYIFSKSIEHSMSNSTELMPYSIVSAWLLMVVIVAYLCVWGYDAALDKLFRAIEFGCNDFCHAIEVPTQNEQA